MSRHGNFPKTRVFIDGHWRQTNPVLSTFDPDVRAAAYIVHRISGKSAKETAEMFDIPKHAVDNLRNGKAGRETKEKIVAVADAVIQRTDQILMKGFDLVEGQLKDMDPAEVRKFVLELLELRNKAMAVRDENLPPGLAAGSVKVNIIMNQPEALEDRE